jgi:hypothetical protein
MMSKIEETVAEYVASGWVRLTIWQTTQRISLLQRLDREA